MKPIRCPYCHEWIPALDYPRHEREHLRIGPDGQQESYVTLPDEQRYQGTLDEVPRVYMHRRCGSATEMPDKFIRSYLENPYLYNADRTFCCECQRHVPFRDCEWTETGEDLQTYMDRLRAARPDLKPTGCFAALLVVGLMLGLGILGAMSSLG